MSNMFTEEQLAEIGEVEFSLTAHPDDVKETLIRLDNTDYKGTVFHVKNLQLKVINEGTPEEALFLDYAYDIYFDVKQRPVEEVMADVQLEAIVAAVVRISFNQSLERAAKEKAAQPETPPAA